MNESIITGVVTGSVVGIVVAAVGAWIGYRLRLKEMRELWAEEERRRKSDRRRELYQRDLRAVSDAVKAMATELANLTWPREELESRYDMIRQTGVMIDRGRVLASSLGDQELMDRYNKLLRIHSDWFMLLDKHTGKAMKGKQDEFDRLTEQSELAAAKVLRRIREILEEV